MKVRGSGFGFLGMGFGIWMVLGLVRPAAAQTSLTIYNDGRVLVRRTFPMAVAAGFSQQRLMLGMLDPASVFSLDSAVVVTGSSYDPAVDEANTIRRSIGRRLTFWTGSTTNGVKDTVAAEVLGVDPERYRLADGRIVFTRPGLPLFGPELVLTEPVLALGVRAKAARPNLALGFFTSGASWQASYSILVAGANARVIGNATFGAGRLRADSAEVQLLAGDVGRASERDNKVQERMVARSAGFAVADAATQQTVGEVHVYSIPGRHQLEPGVATTAMLFEPVNVPVERVYTVRGQIPYWGGLPQIGDEQTEPVQVTYVLKRPLKSEFGDRPVPGGIARIYQRDVEGRPQLVGEGSFDHTAPGKDLRLNSGTAFDLTAKRIQSAYATRRDSTRTIATAAYTVTLSNAKDSAVVVDVIEARGGEWSVLSSSVTAEKLSSTETRFRVRVPAKGDAALTYRVRVIW